MLLMAIRPGPVQLITLEELKGFLRISEADHDKDAILLDLIEHSSAHIQALLLGADGLGFGPEERVDTYRTEQPGRVSRTFLPPFPGPLYDLWGDRSRVPTDPLDFSSLQFVVDQVLGWTHRLQKDPKYARDLEHDVKAWLEESCLDNEQSRADRQRRYAYVRTVASQPSSYKPSPNWLFELRWCSYWPPLRGRLEAILMNPPTENSSRIRFDVLFRADAISPPLATIPPILRRKLRRYAIPVVYIGENRSRDDILAELVIQAAAYLGPDAIKSFSAEVHEWFRRYASRFWPKTVRLTSNDRDSILFDVLAHLAQKYGAAGSGRVFTRYLKLVVHGFVIQHLKERGIEKISVAHLQPGMSKRLGIEPGIQVVGFNPIEDTPVTVLQASFLLGVPRDFVYDAVRKGAVTTSGEPGQRIRLDSSAVRRLRELRKEKTARNRAAEELAAKRGILRKSALRALQRHRQRRNKPLAS